MTVWDMQTSTGETMPGISIGGACMTKKVRQTVRFFDFAMLGKTLK